MGNLLRKQKNTISELLFERGQLRNQVAEWKKKIDRSDELEKTNTMLIEKMKQVMEDIRVKGLETSQAKDALFEAKKIAQDLGDVILAFNRDLDKFKENEKRYLKLLAEKEQELEKLRDDGIDKVRRRLQDQKEENNKLRRQTLDTVQRNLELEAKIKYLEGNAKLEQPRATEAVRDQQQSK